MTRLNQTARIMATLDRQLSIPVPRLFEAVFHQGPVFRMGYDAHVRAWKREMGAAALLQWRHNLAFRQAYEAQVAIDRAAPLPAWKDAQVPASPPTQARAIAHAKQMRGGA